MHEVRSRVTSKIKEKRKNAKENKNNESSAATWKNQPRSRKLIHGMKKSLIPTDKIAPRLSHRRYRNFSFLLVYAAARPIKRYLRPWSSSQATCEPGFSACLIQRFVGYLWNLNVFKSIHRAGALTPSLSLSLSLSLLSAGFTGVNKRATDRRYTLAVARRW